MTIICLSLLPAHKMVLFLFFLSFLFWGEDWSFVWTIHISEFWISWFNNFGYIVFWVLNSSRMYLGWSYILTLDSVVLAIICLNFFDSHLFSYKQYLCIMYKVLMWFGQFVYMFMKKKKILLGNKNIINRKIDNSLWNI